MRRALPLLLAPVILASAVSPARAATVETEVASLPNAGRITIPLASAARAGVRQRGLVVEVTVPTPNDIAAPDSVPRNVVSITGGVGVLRLTVIPGTHFRFKQDATSLVVSITDPDRRGAEAAVGSRPNPAKPAAPPPTVADTPVPSPAPPLQAPAPVSSPSQSSPSQPSPPQPAPPAQAAAEAPAPAAPVVPAPPAVRSFTVGASADTGVAAFRLGGLGVVVFDDEVHLVEGGEGEAALVPAVRPASRGAVMTVPLADGEALAVTRGEASLTVAVAAPTGSAAPMLAIAGGIQIQVGKPGRVMAVSDPTSGQTLLIGTTRQVSGERAAVVAGRSAPGYALVPTWLGVVLETSSDRIDLRASPGGYALALADRAGPTAVAAPRQDNQFGIPDASPAVLTRELDARIASAAAAPARARGPDRVAAARTMLALGLSTEAAALLSLAANDDPAVARDPAVTALGGIAAVLAGRPDDAGGLDDAALPTGGDVALWRGLRDAAQGKPAPALAGAWPLLSAYPEAIRRRIAPVVMEAAAREGADVPASDMVGPALALARALKLVHDGETDAAIAALTEVRDSRDERASVQATVALAELLLRAGRLGPAEAADRLMRQTVRWRGDQLELSLQLRAARLRSEAAQWRTALAGLADLGTVFPGQKAQVAAAQADVFRSLLAADPASVSPMEMVLIAGSYADALPGGDDGDRLAGLLADKLAALDLPSRAVPVLKTLLAKTEAPVARAEYGLRLAQMQLDAGEAAAAEMLLASLDLSDMPPARQAQRTTLLAQAKAARGDFAGAAATLLSLSTPAADELRATYYARAGDWPRSLDALDGLVSATVPNDGDLTDQQQELVLREATAAVQAGDADALKRLGRFDRRLSPARTGLFRVLTATAIKGPEDLPRAARELAMSKVLPDRLGALRSR